MPDPSVDRASIVGGQGTEDLPPAKPVVLDSGDRTAFETGAVRDIITNKCRPELISPIMELRVGNLCTRGVSKYADRNWEKGISINHVIGSIKRHLLKLQLRVDDGEDHEAALVWNSMVLLHTLDQIKKGLIPKSIDDRPDYGEFTVDDFKVD